MLFRICAKIALALVISSLTFLVGWGASVIISKSLDKDIFNECQRLKRQSQEIRGYWLTQNEKEMCDGVEVKIDAFVK